MSVQRIASVARSRMAYVGSVGDVDAIGGLEICVSDCLGAGRCVYRSSTHHGDGWSRGVLGRFLGVR